MSQRFSVERLRRFVADVFEAVGALPEHAAITADRLIEADLRGRNGHGLMRVRQFSNRVRSGGINLRPDMAIERETAVSALIDGDNGLGTVVMTKAVETAIAKALHSGLAWIGTRNSNHAGAAGVYPALALKEGLIGVYMAVAAGNVMPPWGGLDRLLGTSPLAVAIPALDEVPFQLDIATTVTSHGSIKVKQLAGESLPLGWVVGRDGEPITDPARADDGFLLPIGGYKGAGLNFAIGILAGVFNGAAFGTDVVGMGQATDRPSNTGQAILVMRPDLFCSQEEFLQTMDRHLREFRASTPAGPDPVRLPGERAVELEAEQREVGIPVPPVLLAELQQLASELGLERLD